MAKRKLSLLRTNMQVCCASFHHVKFCNVCCYLWAFKIQSKHPLLETRRQLFYLKLLLLLHCILSVDMAPSVRKQEQNNSENAALLSFIVIVKQRSSFVFACCVLLKVLVITIVSVRWANQRTLRPRLTREMVVDNYLVVKYKKLSITKFPVCDSSNR